MKGTRLWKILGWGLVLFVLLNLLFPVVSLHDHGPVRRSETRAGVITIPAALKQYYNEYGRWPDFVGDGRFLDAAGNARIMRVLRAHDDINNPRKIVFFEGKTAEKSEALGGHLGAGFDPQSGAYLDGWGNPYRIVLDVDYDETISSPYSQDDHPSIRRGVICLVPGKRWSAGCSRQPAQLPRLGRYPFLLVIEPAPHS